MIIANRYSICNKLCYDYPHNILPEPGLRGISMNILSSLFLALSLLFNSVASPPAGEPEESAVRISQTFAVRTPIPMYLPSRSLSTRGADWTDMEYSHYTPAAYYAQIEVLRNLSRAGDLDGVCTLYDRLYQEFAYIDAQRVIADIRYSTDVTDAYWSEESLYCAELWSETGNALSCACRQILEGPLGEGFAAHIGPEAAAVFAEYETMTPREAELATREAELINEYYDIMATAEDEAVYTYMGETWTFEKLDGLPGNSLYSEDREGYQEVRSGLLADVNARVGPLYVELVSLRAELADIRGYDSYADYAYEHLYARDYTTDAADDFCEAVKTFSADYYGELYYSELWYAYEDVSPVMDSEELIAALGEHIGLFGEAFSDAWLYMTEHDLYAICGDPNARQGGYTTEIAYYRSPYLYMSLAGDCYDFSTLTHEFGHFAQAYYNPTPNLLTSAGSFDLFEIHSTGLEVLFTEAYDDIYTENADTAVFITLGGLVESVLDGCIYDEFQRRIYENPGMTLEDINRLYARVLREFGRDIDQEMDYTWMYVSHNYDAPLYYISYAVSALASLQLWDMAREDFDAAVETYRAIVAQGAYEDGYLTVLKNAGLRLFTEENAVKEICGPILTELSSLEGAA